MCLKEVAHIPAYRQRLILMLLLIGLTACATPPTPAPKVVTPPPVKEPFQTSLPAIQFTIQVGAFSTIERAARYADKLQAAGLDAYYFVDTDNLCKVRFGKYESREEAHKIAVNLQARKLIQDFYIVQPSPSFQTEEQRSSLRKNLVDTAHRFIGTPYCWGGASLKSGFDCSGLTMTVYRLNGLQLPRVALSQYQNGTPVPRDALQNGDLLFFTTEPGIDISHVGIYTGQDQFIHAPGRGKQIRIASLSDNYFKSRYKGARRYFD